MTTKVDGTNGVLQSYDYQVLTTAFTYTFAAGTTTLIAVPAATLATGTITMPASPADGMVVTFSSTQQITALTVSANTGQTLVGTATQAVPNQPISYIYRLTNTTWYPFAGGAGRASTLVSGTSVASTSGTSIDFTSIPSWVKRITVMFNGVSTSGTSIPLVQLGNSGGIEITGYLGTGGNVAGNVYALQTIGFGLSGSHSAAQIMHGQIIITLISANSWVCSSLLYRSEATGMLSGGGSKTLSATLDRVRITTVNGTDTFDAGTINILVE